MKARVLVLWLCLLSLIPLPALALKIYSQGINVIVMMDDKDIKDIGERSAKQIESANKVVQDPVLQKRVDEAAKDAGADRKHPVKILASPEVNAFCAFDSRIYVNTGLLKLVTDDELFFVLAHEASHGSYGDPEESFKERLKIAVGLSNVGINAEQLIPKLVLGVAEGSYSRDKERRADESAARDLWGKTGSIRAGISLLEKLKKLRGNKGFQGLGRYFASHPPEEKRIELISALGKEKEKLSPQPATKFMHPDQKIGLVCIWKSFPNPHLQEVVDNVSVKNVLSQLNAQGTFVFLGYSQDSVKEPSVDLQNEFHWAKQEKLQFLLRMDLLSDEESRRSKPFGRKVYAWKREYKGRLFRLKDSNIIAEFTDKFEYSEKARLDEWEKVYDREKLAETKFLTDLANRLLAKIE